MRTNLNYTERSGASSKEVNRTQRMLIEGGFRFRPNLTVSKLSKYGDAVWCWEDPSNERLCSYETARITIEWQALQLKYNLTDELIADLKKYAYLRVFYSREIFAEKKGVKNAHPATAVNEINGAALFLRHLRDQLSGEGFCLVKSLADIEVEDLSNALSNYPSVRHEGLRSVLTNLCSTIFRQFLGCGELRWNRQDVMTLPWTIKGREPYQRLPDELFRFLSNMTTSDIKQFLRALGIEPQDKTRIGEEGNIFLEAVNDFRPFFEEYVCMLSEYRHNAKEGKAVWEYYAWSHKKKSRVGNMRRLVERARIAAQLIISMYTGARASELYSFRTGCLERDQDGWFLRGTVIKNKGLEAPPQQDKWVAIPIVRDAVAVLEQTAQLAESNLLFHTLRRLYVREDKRPSTNCVSLGFNKYLKLVDVQSSWGKADLHPHKLRHTLTFQMRKAGLNLPFITFQLKHYFNALQSRVCNTTTGYGGIGVEASLQAIEDANYEFINQTYHPNAPVAGGGAEQFKARRAAYFEGMTLRGIDVEDVLRELAKQGMPMMDVGTGLCQGQRRVVVDGVTADPPCIGQLRCNPVRCSNGIIPQYKIPVWKSIATENRRRATDPELAHATSYYLEAADEADAVIQFLESQKRKGNHCAG